MKQIYFKNQKQWRRWLTKNHDKEKALWLICYKKETGKPSIDYEAIVEEALCFGWIDSTVKKLDDERYLRKITQRNDKSYWSETNKRRAKKVIKEGRMTEFGMDKIIAAKKNGMWNKKIEPPKISLTISDDFKLTLSKNKTAKINFEQLSPSHRKQYIMWINSAKRDETKKRRIKETVELLKNKKKPGLK